MRVNNIYRSSEQRRRVGFGEFALCAFSSICLHIKRWSQHTLDIGLSVFPSYEGESIMHIVREARVSTRSFERLSSDVRRWLISNVGRNAISATKKESNPYVCTALFSEVIGLQRAAKLALSLEKLLLDHAFLYRQGRSISSSVQKVETSALNVQLLLHMARCEADNPGFEQRLHNEASAVATWLQPQRLPTPDNAKKLLQVIQRKNIPHPTVI